MNSEMQSIIQALKKAEKVVVCGHSMPDGDSIGSTIAMGEVLKSLGKDVTMITPDEVPQMYGFLPSINELVRLQSLPNDFDTAVVVDCTDLNRINAPLSEGLAKIPVIINIDHHVSNQYYGSFNYVDPKAAATAELIFNLAKALEISISKEMAISLYTSIVMDTGSFRYENTTEKTHRISAELVEMGVNVALVNSYLFENKELTGLRLLGRSLCNLNVTDCGRVAWISIPYELTKEIGAKDEHAEGIINYPRRVAGVQVGLLFREITPNRIKVGFRSKDTIDVNKIAAVFGGGGHPRAAGCQLEMPIKAAEKEVLETVISQIDQQQK